MEQDGIMNTVDAIFESKAFASIITGVIAFFAGHFFTVYRDKRKEFNVAADRLAETLNRGRSGEIAISEFEDFSRFLSGKSLRRYRETLKKYREASSLKEQKFNGTVDFRPSIPQMTDAPSAEVHFRELASFTKRR